MPWRVMTCYHQLDFGSEMLMLTSSGRRYAGRAAGTAAGTATAAETAAGTYAARAAGTDKLHELQVRTKCTS